MRVVALLFPSFVVAASAGAFAGCCRCFAGEEGEGGAAWLAGCWSCCCRLSQLLLGCCRCFAGKRENGGDRREERKRKGEKRERGRERVRGADGKEGEEEGFGRKREEEMERGEEGGGLERGEGFLPLLSAPI